jgi:NADH-quinone oxidoreductase subunit J
MGQEIGFWVLAVIAVGAAIGVVTIRNVFRTAMALIACFLVIAGIYILLKADFLAAIQILIYVGAIGILIVLGIMLTHDITHASTTNIFQVPAMLIGIALLAGIVYAVRNTNWPISTVSNSLPIDTNTTATIADRLFNENGFVLPLLVIPVLLLATVISAIVLVKVNKK